MPVVVAGARADVARAIAWRADEATRERALARMAATVFAPSEAPLSPLVRHSGGGRNPVVLPAPTWAGAPYLGADLRPHDARDPSFAYASKQPSALADRSSAPSLGPGAADTAPVPASSGFPANDGATATATATATVVPTLTSSADQAFGLATAAYAALPHDRRAAARGFTAALAAAPDATGAPRWHRALDALERRWSGEAYVLFRDGGSPGFGVAPLLGGGQSGAALAWTLDPLARHPLSVVARATVAHRSAGFGIDGFDGGSVQAAVGLRWQVAPGASLTAERMVAVGDGARDAWTLRAAGGRAQKLGPVLADAYAEAGIVGARRRDLFASVQARAVTPFLTGPVRIEPGVSLWSSIQRAGTTVGRFDVGPTVTARAGPVAASLDYRVRVAGHAAPDTGPALTLSARF